MQSLQSVKQFHLSLLFSPGISNSLRACKIKFYSVFPPTFVEPVYHPDDLKKLSPEEVRERAHTPTRPPLSYQNSSVFQDPLLQKFTNHVMKWGRKEKARQIVNDAFEKIKRIQLRKYHLAKDVEKKKNILTNPLQIFHLAIQNSKPVLDVTPVKRGGVMYKVPIAITDVRSTFLALKWMVECAREHEPRRNHTGEFFSDRLAMELLSASEHSGKTVRRKVELHKVCEANKAYAHYRWT